jgi:hypothetical protein
LQRFGEGLEALDRDPGATMLISLDRANRDADCLGKLALREAANLADFEKAGANTAVHGTVI